jgi:acetyltransferase-like isoleucine patch superfamily enzyme
VLILRHRLQSEVTVRRLRRRGAEIAHSARFVGTPIVDLVPGSTLAIGDRVRIVSDSRRTALGVNHAAVLRTLSAHAALIVHEDVGISGGSICVAQRVEIGAGTMLGANVTIADTDFHPLEHPRRRYEPVPTPREEDEVFLGRNVFVGTAAIILRGSIIGDDCVIGAGAVVKGVIPAGSIVAGNPARTLRQVDIQ